MNAKGPYYKGLDENLCARGGFQYEVGKDFFTDTDDPWHWLHFAKKVSTAILYGKRVVEVEPLSTINRYSSADMNAQKVRIVRELPREEILDKLVAEKCRVCQMDVFQPTYAELLRIKEHIRRSEYMRIACEFNWLTAEEKIALLPPIWAHRVQLWEESHR